MMTIAEAILDVVQGLDERQQYVLLLYARSLNRQLSGEPYDRFAAAAAQVDIPQADLETMLRAIDDAFGVKPADE